MSNTVPEGWREGAIGDVVSSMEGGVSVNSENRPPNLNEYGILKTSSVVDGYFRPSECKAILPAEIGRAKVNPKQGAILFSRMNTPALVGQSGYVDKDFLRTFLPDRLWQITIRREFNSRWFSYLLRCDSTVRHIADAATGTSGSMKNISKPSLLGIPVCIPPLPEQQKIAAILSSVDDVIEKTRAQIDKLKDLKTGMMQELLTKGIGPNGAPHTAFKDSPVGRIPEEWECRRIGELFSVQLGKMLSKASKVGDSPLPYLGNKNVQWGRVDLTNLQVMDFNERERKRFLLSKGDLLMCEGGDIGRSAIWECELSECYYQKAIHRLRVLEGRYEPRLLLEYMRFAKAQGLLTEYVSQTSIAHLTKEKLESVPVPVPPLSEQRKIVGLIASTDKKITAIEDRHAKLESLKKALMQDLLTGKVRVKVD